jgi:hypothetical protein
MPPRKTTTSASAASKECDAAPLKNNIKKAGTQSNFCSVLVAVLAVGLPIINTVIFSGDPLETMVPNLLLFTPFREEARSWWTSTVVHDTNVKREPMHLPIIDAKDYSFESLRVATENWRYPAVVRGLFLDTIAGDKWVQDGYLTSKIGRHELPVVRNAIYGTLQNDRSVMKFKDAYEEILGDDNSKLYLFFPVKSRFSFNHSELGAIEALQDDVNKVVLEDLDLDRIWKGFGSKRTHSTFYGSQLIIGRGSNDSMATTGTGWHCAAGNNWFIQVVGGKRWFFMDPKYSKYMHPLRGGKVNMMTGNRNMGQLQNHIPLRYVDLQAGDLLYNPDWEWHTIKNYEGLSIGVPIRELNVSLSLRNNLQYTSIVLVNKLLEKVKTITGIDMEIGGYPPSGVKVVVDE